MIKFLKKICFHKYERAEWFENEFKNSNEQLYKCIKCGKELYVKKADNDWKKEIDMYF